MNILGIQYIIFSGKPVPVGEGHGEGKRKLLFRKQRNGGVGESYDANVTSRGSFLFNRVVVESPVPCHPVL